MSQPAKPVKRNNVGFDLCVFCVSYSFLALICNTAFLVVRILRLLREIWHWNNLYTNKSEMLWRGLMFENWKTFLITLLINFGLLLISLAAMNNNGIKEILTTKQYSLMECIHSWLSCLIVVVMGLYFQWDDSPLSNSYRLENSSTFSGGSSLALGYFYGYLKLILPDLLNKINDFQNRSGLSNEQIPVKKLFILIPSSAFIFDQLRKTGEETIEPLEEVLEPHRQDRGMVVNRMYKNTMYKIKRRSNPQEIKYYVPLEGASPLKTFHETCRQEQKFKECRREVVSSFYYTLEYLIEDDKNVKGLVELIYYDDDKEQDVDVAELVRSRIKYLKKLGKRKVSKRSYNNLNST